VLQLTGAERDMTMGAEDADNGETPGAQ